MRDDELSKVSWLEPWGPVRGGDALDAELRREVGRGHPLFGREAAAVGRRLDEDDFLFSLPQGPSPLAVVHLTWNAERGPEWPHTIFYESLEDWIERRMKPDHADFVRGG